MGLGDMLQAERDAEDAARYRWLKSQFELCTEAHDRNELIEQKGNRTTYETRRVYSVFFNLKDDWRFGHTEMDSPTLDFDALVDELRAETVSGE